MKPGSYKVFPKDVVATGDHSIRLDFEVIEGEHKGEVLSMHVDTIHEIEISFAGEDASVRTTYDEASKEWDQETRSRVSALQVGGFVDFGCLRVRRIS